MIRWCISVLYDILRNFLFINRTNQIMQLTVHLHDFFFTEQTLYIDSNMRIFICLLRFVAYDSDKGDILKCLKKNKNLCYLKIISY